MFHFHQSHHPEIAHIALMVNGGSRHERIAGTAHLLEHLLFKRTKKRNNFQILNRIESLGGDINAYTNKENICIHISIAVAYVPVAIELLADIALNADFNEQDLSLEKSVISDEILGYQDIPEEQIMDDFEEILFGKHSLAHPIMGTVESVNSINKTDAMDFYASAFGQNEIIIGISAIKMERKWEMLIEKYFGTAEIKKKKALPSPAPNTPNTIHKAITTQQCQVVMGMVSSTEWLKLRHTNGLLANILGGNTMTAVLNYKLREKLGLTYSIEANYIPYNDAASWHISFSTEARHLKKCLKTLNSEFEKWNNAPLSHTKLEAYKRKIIGQLALSEENSLSVLIAECKQLLDLGRTESLSETIEIVKGISAEKLYESGLYHLDSSKYLTLIYEPS